MPENRIAQYFKETQTDQELDQLVDDLLKEVSKGAPPCFVPDEMMKQHLKQLLPELIDFCKALELGHGIEARLTFANVMCWHFYAIHLKLILPGIRIR